MSTVCSSQHSHKICGVKRGISYLSSNHQNDVYEFCLFVFYFTLLSTYLGLHSFVALLLLNTPSYQYFTTNQVQIFCMFIVLSENKLSHKQVSKQRRGSQNRRWFLSLSVRQYIHCRNTDKIMLTDKNDSVNKRCIFFVDIVLKPLVEPLLHFLLRFHNAVKLLANYEECSVDIMTFLFCGYEIISYFR